MEAEEEGTETEATATDPKPWRRLADPRAKEPPAAKGKPKARSKAKPKAAAKSTARSATGRTRTGEARSAAPRSWVDDDAWQEAPGRVPFKLSETSNPGDVLEECADFKGKMPDPHSLLVTLTPGARNAQIPTLARRAALMFEGFTADAWADSIESLKWTRQEGAAAFYVLLYVGHMLDTEGRVPDGFSSHLFEGSSTPMKRTAAEPRVETVGSVRTVSWDLDDLGHDKVTKQLFTRDSEVTESEQSATEDEHGSEGDPLVLSGEEYESEEEHLIADGTSPEMAKLRLEMEELRRQERAAARRRAGDGSEAQASAEPPHQQAQACRHERTQRATIPAGPRRRHAPTHAQRAQPSSTRRPTEGRTVLPCGDRGARGTGGRRGGHCNVQQGRGHCA